MQFGAQLRFMCGCALAKCEGTAYSKEPNTNVNSAKCIQPTKSFKKQRQRKLSKVEQDFITLNVLFVMLA